APDGTNTACKFENTGSTGNAEKLGIISNSTTFTYSIYIKTGTALTNRSRLYDDTSLQVKTDATFTYGTDSLSVSIGSGSVENIGDGWYRICMTSNNCTVGNSYRIQLGAFSSVATTGDIWYIWHPQVEDRNKA